VENRIMTAPRVYHLENSGALLARTNLEGETEKGSRRDGASRRTTPACRPSVSLPWSRARLLPLIDYRDGLLNVGVNGAPADVASMRDGH
jgi:hypothetical protein